MDDLPTSDLLRFVEHAFELARRAVARYSSKHSKQRYDRRRHVVLPRLKVEKIASTTYRDLVGELVGVPRIRGAPDPDSIPAPSTLCQASDRLEMATRRARLHVSPTRISLSGVAGTDAAGFDLCPCFH